MRQQAHPNKNQTMTVLVKRHTLKATLRKHKSIQRRNAKNKETKKGPIVDNNEFSIFEPTKNLNTISNQVATRDSVNFYGRIGDSMTSGSGAILKIDDERGRRGARNKIEPVCL